MTIAIYGATRFPGRLVTTEALCRGETVVLVGRNPGRLQSAASEAGSPGARMRVASTKTRHA